MLHFVRKAIVGDAISNKNYRCNPSILVRFRPQGDDIHSNILIDVGKTFRESAVRWFPYHEIRSIDSVVLTHGHADSIFGIDDLRSTQPRAQKRALPVYQSKECELVTRQVFSYLYPSSSESKLISAAINEGSNKISKETEYVNQWETSLPIDETPSNLLPAKKVKRFVANIDWKEMIPYEQFEASGLSIIPIPVMHGEDMTCMGFLFGQTQKVCYLSDISRMLPKTLQMIQDHGLIDLLIVDTIRMGPNLQPDGTHFCSDEAVSLCRQLRPTRTLLIGMASLIDHDEANDKLREILDKEGLDVQLSYDGLKIDMWL